MVLVDPSHEAQGARWRTLDPEGWAAYTKQMDAFYGVMPAPVQAEYRAFEAILEAEHPSDMGPLPDVPLVVLTALRPVDEPRWVGETPAGRQVWFDLHEDLSRRMSNGTHLVTRESGSYIHLEEPKLVVQAVRQVVDAVREGR